MTLKVFLGKKRRFTDDKTWLYDQVLTFITRMSKHETAYLGRVRPRSEREIYTNFAPVSGNPFFTIRYSWDQKNRKVKRQMLAGALRRLVADGKIRVAGKDYPDVSQRKHDVHLFGADYDGIARTYTETNALQAMADALGEE
jgi:hypothetical protein